MSKGKITLFIIIGIIILGFVAFLFYSIGKSSNNKIEAQPTNNPAASPTAMSTASPADIQNEVDSVAAGDSTAVDLGTATTDSNAYKTSYDRIVSQYKNLNSDVNFGYINEMQYCEYDIDKNGIPELIIARVINKDYFSDILALYTFDLKSGKIVNVLGNAKLAVVQENGNIFNYSLFGELQISLLKNNQLQTIEGNTSDWGKGSISTLTTWSYSNNNLTRGDELRQEVLDDDYNMLYTYNGKEISESEYEAKQNYILMPSTGISFTKI